VQLRHALIIVAALGACDSGPSGPDFSGVVGEDLSHTDVANVDLAITNLYCMQTCQAPQACCITPPDIFGQGGGAVCADSCPDGGFFTQCTGPSDCTTQTPNCCVTINLSGDMDASIMSSGGGAMCTADCPAGLSNGNTLFNTKLCHTGSDCANYSGNFGSGMAVPLDGCCTSPRAPGIRFCAPSSQNGNGGLSC